MKRFRGHVRIGSSGSRCSAGAGGRLGQTVRRQDPEPVDACRERQLESRERRNLVHGRWRVPALEADVHQFRDSGGVLGDSDANSGIFIRCQDPAKVGAATCYEVNIFDTRPDQSYRTGGIVDVAKPASVINTGNKWNTLEITAKGPRLMERMNGMQTVDVEDKKFARGRLRCRRESASCASRMSRSGN